MAKRAVLLFLLGVLCVSAARAATKRQVQYKLDGNNASASFYRASMPGDTGGYVSFFINPAPLPDGSWGYGADIYWYDGTNSHEIYGLLPTSVVTATGADQPLHVNITVETFYIVPGSPFGDSGDFISLEGTFAPYTGGGSDSNVETGQSYYAETHLNGDTETSIFKGTSKNQSVTFEGTFVASSGTCNLSVQGPFPDANLFVQMGNQTSIITTP